MTTDRTTETTYPDMPGPRTPSAVDPTTPQIPAAPSIPATRAAPASPLAAASMVAGATCLALAEALHVQVGGEWSTAALLESIATRPERWLLWGVLLMAMSMLLLPGVVAWRARVVATGRRRGRGLTTVGSVVLGASLVAMFAFGGWHADAVAMVGGLDPVPEDLVQAFTRSDSGLGVALTAGTALFGFHLGVPLFLAGLARAGMLQWPVAITGMVAALAAFVVGGIHWYLAVAAFAVTAAVLGYVGVRLLRPAA